MEDKIIEIARFEHAAEAEMLASLLESEGIECFVRDGISSHVMSGRIDIGGAKVDLLKKDARRAVEIMRDHNYEVSVELLEEVSEGDDADESKSKLSKYMTMIVVLMVVLLGIIIFLNKHYNG